MSRATSRRRPALADASRWTSSCERDFFIAAPSQVAVMQS
jgi:hypothetical protein